MRAQDATWVGGGAPTTNEWTQDNNWNPATAPTGTATFDVSAVTAVTSSGVISVNAINFTNVSSTYTINTDDIVLIQGLGVTNNNIGATQTIDISSVGPSVWVFLNSSSASAGPGAVTYNISGTMTFVTNSTAGNATINNGGDLEFNNNSTAGTATIVNTAVMNFQDASSASTANITNNATGTIAFNLNEHGGERDHRQQRRREVHQQQHGRQRPYHQQ